MKTIIPLSEIANTHPIMVTLYPDVFSRQNSNLSILYIPQLDIVLDRIDTFKTMLDINKLLMVKLYTTEKAYYINKVRHEPLEDWIVRYDKGMGNTMDMTSLARDMNLIVTSDDISDQLYRMLLFKIIELKEGRDMALKEMKIFVDEH